MYLGPTDRWLNAMQGLYDKQHTSVSLFSTFSLSLSSLGFSDSVTKLMNFSLNVGEEGRPVDDPDPVAMSLSSTPNPGSEMNTADFSNVSEACRRDEREHV